MAVISAEQISQIYLSPPSVPRDMVFFLITPIVRLRKYLLLCCYSKRVRKSLDVARACLPYIKSSSQSMSLFVHDAVCEECLKLESSLFGTGALIDTASVVTFACAPDWETLSCWMHARIMSSVADLLMRI